MSSLAHANSKEDALKLADITARRARQIVDELTRRRDLAISVARQEGASLREIAEATELSHTAIQKILDRLAAAKD